MRPRLPLFSFQLVDVKDSVRLVLAQGVGFLIQFLVKRPLLVERDDDMGKSIHRA